MRSLILTLILLLSSTALADREEAQRLFGEATEAYNLGNFEEASRLYEAAYEAEKLPELLFNIAQARFGAKDYERAIFFYEAYIRELPEASDRDTAEARIVEAQTLQKQAALEARLEAERREKEAEAKAEAERARRAEAEAKRAAEEARRAEEERKRQEAEEVPPVFEQEWFWPTVGGTAGAVAVISGVVLVTWLVVSPPDTLPPVDLQ